MKSRFLVIFLLAFSSAFAQNDSLLKDRFYRHTYENDFFTATDRYYTQGVYLEFIFPSFKKLLLSKALIPLRPGCRRVGTHVINYYGISTERQGFTPSTIRHFGEPEPGERPYAAVVYLTHSLVSLDRDRRLKLTTRISTGFMGPNLFGEEEQIAIHTQLGNILPVGWEYQIENDYVLNYDLFLEKAIFDTQVFTFTTFTEARAGTLYDDLSVGSMLRIGSMHPFSNGLGLTRNKNAGRFQCYLYLRAKVKAVAYNATMQGGVINHNSSYVVPASDVERLVGSNYGGIVVAYKKLSLEFALAGITKEYRKGKNHAWGRVGINVCF